MPGIFGDLFDFDGDGKLNCAEQAAEFIAFDEMMKADQSDENYDGAEFIVFNEMMMEDQSDEDYDGNEEEDF